MPFSRKQFLVYFVYIVSCLLARIPEKRSFIKNGLLALCENDLEPKIFLPLDKALYYI